MEEGLGCCFGGQLAVSGKLQKVASGRPEGAGVRVAFKLMSFWVYLERTVPEPIRFPVSPHGVGVLTFTPIVGAAADTPYVTHAGALAVRKLTGFVFVDPRTAVNGWMQLDKSFAELLFYAGLHHRVPL